MFLPPRLGEVVATTVTPTDASAGPTPQEDIRPVFLLSAPRSGSTLVQRVLAAHRGVATASEPWLLLPLLGTQRADLPQAGSWQRVSAHAIGDFAGQLPGGQSDLDAALREAALTLYRGAAGPEATHFLDKTPGYSLIVDDIARVFPEGVLLFLWRNPLGVLSSIVETLDGGRFRPSAQSLTLFDGPARMVAAAQRLGSRAVAVRYEDLVSGDPDAWRPLTDAMGVPLEPDALRAFTDVRLSGAMGDPTGVHRYNELSTEPLRKWQATLGNPVRRAWARRWLRWLGRERLAVMGYELDDLLRTLDGLAAASFGDAADIARDVAGLTGSMGREVLRARALDPTTSTWRLILAS